MNPLDFLEQFGAVAKSDTEMVYPQYKEPVHVVDYCFNRRHPVILAIDPSNGANEYAVVALQDYGDTAYVFDEFYKAGVLAEEAIAWAKAQPWCSSVREGVMDCANPSEIERWINAGFNVFGVQEKPRPEDRYPLYRKLLRDPVTYQRLWQQMLADYCRERQLAMRDFERLPAEEQRRIVLVIEERLSQPNLPADTVDQLRRCAHIFIARNCVHTIDEHAHFAFQRRRERLNQPERARQFKDHIMDALGYWAWTYKRFDFVDGVERVVDTIPQRRIDTLTLDERRELAESGTITPDSWRRHFLYHMRQELGIDEPERVTVLLEAR